MKPQLNDEEYIFKLNIHGIEYDIDTKWLLHLHNEITSEQSSIELEECLEKISGYLHTFSVAYEQYSNDKAALELEYDIWYKEKYAEAESDLVATFAADVRSNIRSKSNANPTKAQVEAAIVNNNKEEYREFQTRINKIKIMTEFLWREMKIIENRAMHIQSILNLRRRTMEREI